MARLIATLLIALSVVLAPANAGFCVHLDGGRLAVADSPGTAQRTGAGHAGVHHSCSCGHHLGDRVGPVILVAPSPGAGPAVAAIPDPLAASRSPGPLLEPPSRA